MRGEPISILHVEDEPAHAMLVQRFFEDSAIATRLVQVPDGQAALDYLYSCGERSGQSASSLPGIILLDLRLPRVDGLEVLKIVKADMNLRHIPVVILTTSDAETDIVRAYDNQANSFLVKPVDFRHFTTMMESFSSYWLSWNCRSY